MRAFKPYSLIALFVALNNSFKDHIIGSRLFRFHPKHLRTTYVRVEADDLHLSDFINDRTEGNILNSKSVA